MFHLVGFSKVLIRGCFFFFWQFCGLKSLAKLSNFFTIVFFKFTLQELNFPNVFVATLQKFAPKQLSVWTIDTWAMMGCDMLPCPHCHSLSLRWNNNLITNFVL